MQREFLGMDLEGSLRESLLSSVTSVQIMDFEEADLFSATAERCNLAVVNECVDTFAKTVEANLSSVPFVNEREFNRIQETAQEEALTMFKKSRKMDDSQAITGAEAELMAKLGENISHYRSSNENKLAEARQQFETKVREILDEYEAEMKSKVLGDDVLYEDVFEDIHSQVATNARQRFADLQCDPSLEPEVMLFLAQQIQNTDKWLHLIKLNRERAEQALQAVVFEGEREYGNSLDPSKFTAVQDLETAEAEARLVALNAVRNFPQKLRESTMNKAETELTTQLNTVYKNVREKVQKNIEQMNLQLVIEDAVRQYKKSMKSLLLSLST